jgi:hypothetical protein
MVVSLFDESVQAVPFSDVTLTTSDQCTFAVNAATTLSLITDANGLITYHWVCETSGTHSADIVQVGTDNTIVAAFPWTS